MGEENSQGGLGKLDCWGWRAGITAAFFASIVCFAVSLASPLDKKVEALFTEVGDYKKTR